VINKSIPIIIVIIIGLVLGACGSVSKDVPSIAATPTVVSEKEPLNDEAKVMAFSQCMRDKGIEYKDPVVDSEGYVQQPELVEGVTYSPRGIGSTLLGLFPSP
jgi:hypothetical protein